MRLSRASLARRATSDVPVVVTHFSRMLFHPIIVAPSVPHEGNREEVLNIRLADLLHHRGLLAVPEQIRTWEGGKRLPDIIIGYLQGLRIIIEGKVSDSPAAQGAVERDAKGRVEEGLAPICLAVLYPAVLRSVPPDRLAQSLSVVRLRIRVYSEEGEGEWVEGDVDTLSAVLRRAYESMVQEDIVRVAVEEIDRALDTATDLLLTAKTSPDRLRKALGIEEIATPKESASEE